MSYPINSKDEYDKVFCKYRHNTLKCALETRKFEIELYWKRTAYFSTLIGAAFVGFCTLSTSSRGAHPGLIFLVSCIGLILSVGWYLANRGSKFWQENWEAHVSMLQDEFIGPLFKEVIDEKRFEFCKLHAGYPYSVSKVNQLISLFIAIVWLGLVVKSFPHSNELWNWFINLCLHFDCYWGLLIITVAFAIFLFVWGRTSNSTTTGDVNFTRR